MSLGISTEVLKPISVLLAERMTAVRPNMIEMVLVKSLSWAKLEGVC
ncbi:MAG: hypothetical protein ACKESB_00950 [Candidatus Hodgkinia cicadicola]